MLTIEEQTRIIRAYRLGMSIREIARRFHHGRSKIREVLKNPEPRHYRRIKVHRPKLSKVYCRRIFEIIEEEGMVPSGQRSTAASIFRQLQSEGYQGGYDQVRRFVALCRIAP